eukprot:3591958-Amphidinium_carterae.1
MLEITPSLPGAVEAMRGIHAQNPSRSERLMVASVCKCGAVLCVVVVCLQVTLVLVRCVTPGPSTLQAENEENST